MTARSVIIERELPYPPAKVWRALTEGSLIQQWLMDNDFQPIVGHAFTFRSTPVPNWDGIIQSQILVVEPNQKLSYTWGTLGLESIVTFTLSPTEIGTLLHMEHAGFRDDQQAAYKGAQYGWQRFLGSLDKLLANVE